MALALRRPARAGTAATTGRYCAHSRADLGTAPLEASNMGTLRQRGAGYDLAPPRGGAAGGGSAGGQRATLFRGRAFAAEPMACHLSAAGHAGEIGRAHV